MHYCIPKNAPTCTIKFKTDALSIRRSVQSTTANMVTKTTKNNSIYERLHLAIFVTIAMRKIVSIINKLIENSK